MAKQSKENIFQRLIISFCILIILFILFGLFSLRDMRTDSKLTRTIYDHLFAVSKASLRSDASITKMHRSMKDIVLFNFPLKINASIEAVNEQEQAVYKYLDIVKNRMCDEGRILEEEARKLFNDWKPIRKEVIELVLKGQRKKAAKITMEKGADHVKKLDSQILALKDHARSKAFVLMQNAEKVHSRMHTNLIAFLIIGVILSSLVAFFTIKRIMTVERSITESEALLEAIQQLTKVGGWKWDIEKQTMFWTNEVYRIHGFEPSEFPQDSTEHIERSLACYDPEDRPVIMAAFRECAEKGQAYDLEFPFTTATGRRIWIRTAAEPMIDGDMVIKVIGNIMDITERKQAEDALRESEAKYRAMMESMNDLVYICSPDYRVEYMNPSMIKRTGRDATGEYCFKALHDLEEKCPWCLHKSVQQGRNIESDIVSPKNNRSYQVSQTPIFHEDGSISKMTIFRDTTDFKKMETQLQQAQKMEAIGTLAGGIAHDFNNILFPISGYTEMLLLDTPGDSPLRHGLSEILAGVKRAGDLVSQILTFSRQREHELKPLKVEIVVKEALKLIRSSLPTTIEILQNVNKDCGLVMADPTQLHQIVMNLCTNAFHAMEENGGKLTITLKEVELSAEDLKDPSMIPGPHVCLTVADTGPGMEQSIIDRIFDPYFTTKEEGKGTGLGLAVVHGIIKSHGGHISVYSEPGKGTEFKVHLPVIKEQKETSKVETDTPIQKGDERILLVDDQDIIVQIEKQMLELLGYHVTARTSSVEALEAFRMQPDKFDIVITDLTMPNITGDKLSVEIMKIRSDIPVILCTGFSEMMSKEKAEALGIKGFMLKPVVLKDLSEMIRKVLDKK